MQVRGIDKHSDPNEKLAPVECETDKKMTGTLFSSGVEMDKKYKARYGEKLRNSKERAGSLGDLTPLEFENYFKNMSGFT